VPLITRSGGDPSPDVGEVRHIWKEAVVEWAKAARRDTQPSTLNRYLVSSGQVDGIVDGLLRRPNYRQNDTRGNGGEQGKGVRRAIGR